MAWRSLQLSMLILIISFVATAFIQMGLFPGLISTPTNVNAEQLMNQVDQATSGTPGENIPIIGDVLAGGQAFLQSTGAVGTLIWNTVCTYSFLDWLGCSDEVCWAGQSIAAIFHAITLIELKTGRSMDN
ncbi:hypothetical protein [Methanocella sp. MCL-LM]|uniref:hypothetical protein n=1 Tax=Methanocella sp. MCL-LM TaxID=3412035 RepID=UPI003C7579F1